MAKQTELRVSYSVGQKVNIGNYQSVDVHHSQSVTFDVLGDSQTGIDNLATNQYEHLKDVVDERLNISVEEIEDTYNLT